MRPIPERRLCQAVLCHRRGVGVPRDLPVLCDRRGVGVPRDPALLYDRRSVGEPHELVVLCDFHRVGVTHKLPAGCEGGFCRKSTKGISIGESDLGTFKFSLH